MTSARPQDVARAKKNEPILTAVGARKKCDLPSCTAQVTVNKAAGPGINTVTTIKTKKRAIFPIVVCKALLTVRAHFTNRFRWPARARFR